MDEPIKTVQLTRFERRDIGELLVLAQQALLAQAKEADLTRRPIADALRSAAGRASDLRALLA